MKLIEVEDKKNLYRDSETNAIINTDLSALEKIKLERSRRIKDRQRLDSLEQKVERILNLLESKL